MAKASAVWGIDIGQCALKAVKLHRVGEEVAVEAFDIIEHEKILSQPDADRPALVRAALEQFLSRNNVRGAMVAISPPGLTSFPCYVKLPPVEPKKIPDIIRFEAQQQIPLPLEEVVWEWQTFQDPDSPDIEVGIFAVRRSDMAAMLGQFSGVALQTDLVQMGPLALYNFMAFDGQRAEDGATLLVDVGTDKTDLIVADKSRMWTRTIRIGGNNFTEALVRGFKLSFSKAERLKRTAATSKYARQIFQAMRPVFADLVQEVQRSLGHYTSLHRETRLKKILALGNGFRLPGFQKYLEQNLNIPVQRLDGYNRLKTTGPADTPVFTENIMSFAVAYGLAVQGLGLGAIGTNLLPAEIARRRVWATKKPWFVAATAVLLAAVGLVDWRTFSDASALQPGDKFFVARNTLGELDGYQTQYDRWSSQGNEEEDRVKRYWENYGYRSVQPVILNMFWRAVADFAKHQPKFGDSQEQRRRTIETLQSVPRNQRFMITVESLDMTYLKNVGVTGTPPPAPAVPLAEMMMSDTPAPAEQPHRGLMVILKGRTPLPPGTATPYLLVPLLKRCQEIAPRPLDGSRSPIRVYQWMEPRLTPMTAGTGGEGAPTPSGLTAPPPTGYTGGSGGPPGAGTTARIQSPDPLFPNDPNEDMINDTRFEIGWIVVIENDGLPALPSAQPEPAR